MFIGGKDGHRYTWYNSKVVVKDNLRGGIKIENQENLVTLERTGPRSN